MSEIKALYNLHKMASNFRSDVYKRDEADYLLEIADGIQAEVDSLFMALPLDADGVPWTLETESFVDDTGAKVVFSGLEVDYAGRWKIRSNCVLHDPSLCRHVKPDPLKELLNDRINDVLRVMTSGIGIALETALNDSFGEECADEIRELMKEGGE